MVDYNWENNEANFANPVKNEVDGGTHITFEILLKKGEKFIAMRRIGIPGHVMTDKEKEKPMLYFCHDLIRYGESVDDCVKRIVKSQSGVNVVEFKTVLIDSFIKGNEWGLKIKQWAIIPYVIADVDRIPKPGRHGNDIIEVVVFTKNKPPEDLAWWKPDELKEFLSEYC